MLMTLKLKRLLRSSFENFSLKKNETREPAPHGDSRVLTFVLCARGRLPTSNLQRMTLLFIGEAMRLAAESKYCVVSS